MEGVSPASTSAPPRNGAGNGNGGASLDVSSFVARAKAVLSRAGFEELAGIVSRGRRDKKEDHKSVGARAMHLLKGHPELLESFKDFCPPETAAYIREEEKASARQRNPTTDPAREDEEAREDATASEGPEEQPTSSALETVPRVEEVEAAAPPQEVVRQGTSNGGGRGGGGGGGSKAPTSVIHVIDDAIAPAKPSASRSHPGNGQDAEVVCLEEQPMPEPQPQRQPQRQSQHLQQLRCKLKEYKQMLDEDLITQADYDAVKRKLLERSERDEASLEPLRQASVARASGLMSEADYCAFEKKVWRQEERKVELNYLKQAYESIVGCGQDISERDLRGIKHAYLKACGFAGEPLKATSQPLEGSSGRAAGQHRENLQTLPTHRAMPPERVPLLALPPAPVTYPTAASPSHPSARIVSEDGPTHLSHPKGVIVPTVPVRHHTRTSSWPSPSAAARVGGKRHSRKSSTPQRSRGNSSAFLKQAVDKEGRKRDRDKSVVVPNGSNGHPSPVKKKSKPGVLPEQKRRGTSSSSKSVGSGSSGGRGKHQQSQQQRKSPSKQERSLGLLGQKVGIWWPVDMKFYPGTIMRRRDGSCTRTSSYKIVYEDGVTEYLDLSREKFMYDLQPGRWLGIWWEDDKKFYYGQVKKVRPMEVFLEYADGAEEWLNLAEEVVDLRPLAEEVSALLGKRIDVLFKEPPSYFSGKVANYDWDSKKHFVEFDDGCCSEFYDLLSDNAIRYKRC